MEPHGSEIMSRIGQGCTGHPSLATRDSCVSTGMQDALESRWLASSFTHCVVEPLSSYAVEAALVCLLLRRSQMRAFLLNSTVKSRPMTMALATM